MNAQPTRKPIPEALFKQYRNMIRQKAWYYAKNYKMDFDECEAEGNLIFCEAWQTFNPELGYQFSTHLGHQLGRIVSHCRKDSRLRGDGHHTDSMEFLCVAASSISEDIAAERSKESFVDAVAQLEGDACVLIHAILEGALTRDHVKSWKNPNLPFARQVFATWGRSRVDAAWYEVQTWWRQYESQSILEEA